MLFYNLMMFDLFCVVLKLFIVFIIIFTGIWYMVDTLIANKIFSIKYLFGILNPILNVLLLIFIIKYSLSFLYVIIYANFTCFN